MDLFYDPQVRAECSEFQADFAVNPQTQKIASLRLEIERSEDVGSCANRTFEYLLCSYYMLVQVLTVRASRCSLSLRALGMPTP